MAISALLMLAPLRAASPDAPRAPVFDVFKYGAKGDGTTNDRAALQRAIDACKGSGGSVYLHDGKFLTGQITLGSDMTLFIAPSATLLGIQTTDETEYPAKEIQAKTHMNLTCQKRLIFGEGLKNITLTGGGTIDGQGDFAPWVSRGAKIPEKLRPSLLEIASSERVEVSNLHILRPGMWTQVYVECTGLTLRNLIVDTENLPANKDGMDICDCHDVLIEKCDIRAQDDGICFKSGSKFGCRDIVVRDCVIDKFGISAGNCLKFGTASFGAFANVQCYDLVLRNTGNTAITWEAVDGSDIDNVVVHDCEVSGVAQVISVILGQRHGELGSISNLTFKNITSTGGVKPIACLVTGVAGHPVRNVTFSGLRFRFPGGVTKVPEQTREYHGEYPEGTHFGDLPGYAFFLRHVDGVKFSQCNFSTDQPDARPWLATDDVAHCEETEVTATRAQ